VDRLDDFEGWGFTARREAIGASIVRSVQGRSDLERVPDGWRPPIRQAHEPLDGLVRSV
jgi:hypothetical protein